MSLTPSSRAGLGGGPPEGSGGVLDLPFGVGDLHRVRASVAAYATLAGALPPQVAIAVLVASELALNAIRHAGGTGRICLWRDGDDLQCQVTDTGPGFDDLHGAGRARPAGISGAGRGLWVVREVSEGVWFDRGPAGLTVTARIRLVLPTSDGR